MDALEKGLWDVLSFRLGLRPLLNEGRLWRLVFGRFDALIPRPEE